MFHSTPLFFLHIMHIILQFLPSAECLWCCWFCKILCVYCTLSFMLGYYECDRFPLISLKEEESREYSFLSVFLRTIQGTLWQISDCHTPDILHLCVIETELLIFISLIAFFFSWFLPYNFKAVQVLCIPLLSGFWKTLHIWIC